MFGTHHTDVLVAGAGPVGLFTALCLAERGIRTEVIDEERRPAAHSYALCLHPRTLQLLNQLGLADDLIRKGRRVERIAFHEGHERIGELTYRDLPGPYPFLLVLRQDVLEAALEHKLRAQHIKVQWNHRLSGDLKMDSSHAVATIEELAKQAGGYAIAHTSWVVERRRKTSAAFIVGADGSRSAVRRALEIDFEAVDDPEHYAVFEFRTDAQLNDEVHFVFANGTRNVMWPLPDGRCRWGFQIPGHDVPADSRTKGRLAVQVDGEAYPYLDESVLLEFLAERAPWFRGTISDLSWSMAVRFERRLASRFGQGRAWLAGDAAHLTGPNGVQSMNIGLAEGHALAEHIADALQNGGDPCDFETYNSERMAEWRMLLGLDDNVRRGSGCPGWVAHHAAELLSCIPASGEELAHLLAQWDMHIERKSAAALVG